MNLENKTILVTGSNRGIGQAIVAQLLKRGVKKIYAAARDISKLPNFDDERVENITLDITQPEQIKQAAKKANDIDILINNAGVAASASLLDTPIDLIERDMNTNYYGTLSMIREFIPALENKPGGAIVNVVSIVAFASLPALGGYCASKAALFSLSQGIRTELAPKGIQVHTVNPGPIDTDMAKDFQGDKPSALHTAENILLALEADEIDIFPDDMGQHMIATWKNDYRDLEKMFADMHNA